jgi:hypothetical protein
MTPCSKNESLIMQLEKITMKDVGDKVVINGQVNVKAEVSNHLSVTISIIRSVFLIFH